MLQINGDDVAERGVAYRQILCISHNPTAGAWYGLTGGIRGRFRCNEGRWADLSERACKASCS